MLRSYVIYIQAWGAAGFNNGDKNVWSQQQTFTLDMPPAALPTDLNTTVENGQLALAGREILSYPDFMT